MLSGDRNTDFMILMELNDNELGKVCSVNKYVNSLCNNDNFWMKRINMMYKYSYKDSLDMKNYLEFDTWKELYIWLNEIRKNYEYDAIKIILKSLKKKKYINELMELCRKRKFPRWINREEYLKEFKRKIFININTELNISDYEANFEHGHENGYDILSDALGKVSSLFDMEVGDNIYPIEVYKLLYEKYSDNNLPELL